MKYAKAIYTWWKNLSVWIRIPLCIVLVIALLALVVVESAIRFIWPARSNPYQPVTQARAAQAERGSETLKKAVEKADKRLAEIKEKIKDENDTIRDFEKAIDAADSIDAVDDLIAKRSGREQREQRERQKRREHND